MNSWPGKLLRVNLTQGTWTVEDIDPKMARDYIGGRGLGTKIFCDEVSPDVDPLSPENKLIMLSGPLTATGAPASARYMVVTKSPLTGTIASSNSGGYFPAELRFAGFNGIIFEGKSEKPVSLYIREGEVELRDASHLWGKTTDITEDMIRSEIEDKWDAKETRIACIGPAGEKLSKLACIMNDKHRAAGRSGVGAVMGSKNVKAIVVRGTQGVQIADFDNFKTGVRTAMDKLAAGPVTSEGLPAYGTAILVNIINECGILPTNNFQLNMFDNASKISGESIAENIMSRNKGCFACSIACARMTSIEDPKYAGHGEGPEYETVELMGADCGIDDLAPITKANYLCNEYGIDTISAACTVATAMELYEKGYISKEKAGMDLSFGNGEALVKLIEQMGTREGLGDDATDGSFRLAEKYGFPEAFMGVKKLEIPAYDPRGVQGMGLTYATSNRGACHVRGYTIANEVLGVHEKMDPLVTEGKAPVVKVFQDLTALVDSSGLCLFVTLTPGMGFEEMKNMIAGATGFDYSVEEIMAASERIWNLEKLFNMKAGFTKEDDTLPKRLLEVPLPLGGPKGQVCRLGDMLPEYYELRGWDKDGIPTAEKLSELGLEGLEFKS
jgi:aldehyde:ferredoxin oxidoreductase